MTILRLRDELKGKIKGLDEWRQKLDDSEKETEEEHKRKGVCVCVLARACVRERARASASIFECLQKNAPCPKRFTNYNVASEPTSPPPNYGRNSA